MTNQDDPSDPIKGQTCKDINEPKEVTNETYNTLSSDERTKIDYILDDAADTMSMYKNMSYMYPNWLNVDDRSNNKTEQQENKPDYSELDTTSVQILMNEKNTSYPSSTTSYEIFRGVGFFVMNRTIDEKFNVIESYRQSVNNPIHRALWHIASVLDFRVFINPPIDTNTSFDRLTQKFLNLLDVFCVLSRRKSDDEFKGRYVALYHRILGANPEDRNETVPMWMFHKYNMCELPCIYKNQKLSNINLLSKLKKQDVFELLKDRFNPKLIVISTVKAQQDRDDDETKSKNESLKSLFDNRSRLSSHERNLYSSSAPNVGSDGRSRRNRDTRDVRTHSVSYNYGYATDKGKDKQTYNQPYSRRYGKSGYLPNKKTNIDVHSNWRIKDPHPKSLL